MSLNGESITIPIIDAGETGSITEETTLSTGTKVSISVRFENPDNDVDGNEGVTRVYTVHITDCYEDITVTSGNTAMHDYTEMIMERLEGVENSQIYDVGAKI